MSSTSASLVNNLNRKRPSIDTPVITNRGPLFSFIDFNTGEFCNRKCSFCPRAEPLEYPNQKIFSSLRLAKALASQLNALNYSGIVNLCGYGEPLANPDILDIIEVLSPTCSLELVTNGDYLNVELVQQLYSRGLHHLVISAYDGPHQIEKFNDILSQSSIDTSRYTVLHRWSSEDDYGFLKTNRAGFIAGDSVSLT